MKIFTLALAFVLGVSGASAATYTIPAGSNATSFQATISAAVKTGGIVNIAAGTSTLGSQIFIACPSSALVIQGPVNSWPIPLNARPQANLRSGMGGGMLLAIGTPCSTPISILNLEIDGQHPTTGGGAVYVGSSGASNLTFSGNYFHGNQEPVPTVSNGYTDFDTDATLIYLDGWNGSGAPVDSNIVITNNIFGNPAPGDCSGVMTWVGGLEADGKTWTGYDANGGTCGALGVHVSTTGLVFKYNVVQQQEQPMKFYEGGSADPSLYHQVSDDVEYNDIGFYHRIALETQQSPTDSAHSTVIAHNYFHDPVNGSFGSWGISAPQGTYTNITDNLMVSNQATAGPADFEFWGTGHNDNNLEQGNISCGTDFGYGVTPSGSISGNIRQFTAANCNVNGIQGIQAEYQPSQGLQTAAYPAMVGNTYANGVSPLTSATPSISQSNGVVTISDAGNSVGPRGNTGIWYTTDGSNPVPGSGTAQYYTGPFSANGTVKAVGMWGAANQSTSYPSGFGFLPSAVVSTSASGGGVVVTPPPVVVPPAAPTSLYMDTEPDGVNTMTVGGMLQFQIIGVYTGSADAPVTGGSFSSSNPAVATVDATSGMVTAVSAGTTNISGNLNGLGSSFWTVTVSGPTAPAVTLQSLAIATLGTSSAVVGKGTLQFSATATYSDGSTQIVTPTYTVSNAFATISATGALTPLAAGTVNVTATFNGVTSNMVAVTVTAPLNLSLPLGTYTLTVSATGVTIVQN